MANETDRNIARNQKPPKSKNGGRRPGAGRPRGSRNRRTIALSQATAEAQQVARIGETPLDFLLRVMRNTKNAMQIRIDAAKAAAPYIHPRLSSIELNQNPKGETQEDWVLKKARERGLLPPAPERTQ